MRCQLVDFGASFRSDSHTCQTVHGAAVSNVSIEILLLYGGTVLLISASYLIGTPLTFSLTRRTRPLSAGDTRLFPCAQTTSTHRLFIRMAFIRDVANNDFRKPLWPLTIPTPTPTPNPDKGRGVCLKLWPK